MPEYRSLRYINAEPTLGGGPPPASPRYDEAASRGIKEGKTPLTLTPVMVYNAASCRRDVATRGLNYYATPLQPITSSIQNYMW
jgi:hypothetical protein